MGVGNLVGITSFYKVNLLLDLGISSSGCIDARICAAFAGICVFCGWHYTADESGKTLIYPKGKIYGVHIRYVKIRRTKPLNGSKLNSLAS